MNAYIGLARGDASFVARWADICRQGQREHDEWVESLRAQGIKAAHPDDGWVDREKSTVHFAYPQFNDGVKVGDQIALGWPGKHNKTRIVTITAHVPGLFSPETDRWAFSENT